MLTVDKQVANKAFLQCTFSNKFEAHHFVVTYFWTVVQSKQKNRNWNKQWLNYKKKIIKTEDKHVQKMINR